MTLQARLLSLAGRTVGVASDEVPGCDQANACTYLGRLVHDGRAVVLRQSSANGVRARYFTTEGLRDAYAREHAVTLPLADRLRARLKLPGGFKASEIDDDVLKVRQALMGLRRRGEVFTVNVTHKDARHFGNKAEAEAFAAWARASQRSHGVTGSATATVAGSGGFARDAKVVTPKHVKVQRCPAWTPRFASFDAPNVHGGNQRGRVPELPAQAAADWAQALAALRGAGVA